MVRLPPLLQIFPLLDIRRRRPTDKPKEVDGRRWMQGCHGVGV